MTFRQKEGRQVTPNLRQAEIDSKQDLFYSQTFFGDRFKVSPSLLNSDSVHMITTIIDYEPNVVNTKVLHIQLFSFDSIRSALNINKHIFPNLGDVTVMDVEKTTIKYLKSQGIDVDIKTFDEAECYSLFTESEELRESIRGYIRM